MIVLFKNRKSLIGKIRTVDKVRYFDKSGIFNKTVTFSSVNDLRSNTYFLGWGSRFILAVKHSWLMKVYNARLAV